jgi:hypothetical protein
MNITAPRLFLALSLVFACEFSYAAQDVNSAMRKAEERQMVEESGPKAEYNRSVKEAHAAYAEAVKECGKQARNQRTSCMKDAKTNLTNDLASAKTQSGNTAAGSGRQRRER